MKKLITALMILIATGIQAQNYPFLVETDAPCNLLMYNGSKIEENWLLKELTWINTNPNYLQVRDNERTFTIRENQIGDLENDFLGISDPAPNTIADLVSFLEASKEVCLIRVSEDTLFVGIDTLITGGGGPTLYSANGTIADPSRTVNVGGGDLTISNGDDIQIYTDASIDNLARSNLFALGILGSTVGYFTSAERLNAPANDFRNVASIRSDNSTHYNRIQSFGQSTAGNPVNRVILSQQDLANNKSMEFGIYNESTTSLLPEFQLRFNFSPFVGTPIRIKPFSFQAAFESDGATTASTSLSSSGPFPPDRFSRQTTAYYPVANPYTATIIQSFYNSSGDIRQAFLETSARELGVWDDAAFVHIKSQYNGTNSSEIKINDGVEFNFVNGGIGTGYRFPINNGNANEVLTTNGLGQLSWAPAGASIWENNAGTYQIIDLIDTSVQIQDSLMLLNGANISDNKDFEMPRFDNFGTFLTTLDRYDASLILQPGTPINVWANTNPLERAYRWRDAYVSRESNFALPGGLGTEQNYTSVLNTDGNIWMLGFDWGGAYVINPRTNAVERTTDGTAIAGQANVNADGLTYVTQISFNPIVINTQMRELAILAYPAFDVTAGFTKFNTYFGGSIASYNNVLYQAPYASTVETRLARFDLNNNTGSYMAGNINTAGAGQFEYTACTEAIDGKVYCMPFDNDYLLEIDPVTDTWIQWGDGNANPVVGAARGGWSIIAHPNGKLYAPPFNGGRVMEIDPVLKTITEIGSSYLPAGPGAFKWGSAALHQNGKIYCFPYTGATAQGVLVIDPATGTTTTIALTTSHPYWGTKVAENGSIWGLPQYTNQTVTRLDIPDIPIYPSDFATAPQFQSR